MKLYIDTNVIIDFLWNRDSSAYSLFCRALRCEFSLIISPVVLEELRFQGLAPETTTFIKLFSTADKLEIVPSTFEDRLLARKEMSGKKTHYNDALHKVLSAKSKADIFVTNNIKHFKCFSDLVVRRPDEL